MVKSITDDCNLTAHIVEIILNIQRIAGFSEGAGQGVANHRISDMAHMEWSVGVGARVFNADTPFLYWKSPETRADGLKNYLIDVILPINEVNIRADCRYFNPYLSKRRGDRFCNIPCYCNRRHFSLFCERKSDR